MRAIGGPAVRCALGDRLRGAAAVRGARRSKPAALRNADPALVVEQPFDPRWWAQFEDPVLDGLVTRALEANHDVRIAVARVDQARAFFDDVALTGFRR